MKSRRKRWGLVPLLACALGSAQAQSFSNTELSRKFFAHLEANPGATALRENLHGRTATTESATSEDQTLQLFVPASKRLAWAAFLKEFKVLIFDPTSKSWPGTQPITVILTDADLNVLDWIEIGGEPAFHHAEIDEHSHQLKVTYRQRSGGALIQLVQILPQKLELTESSSMPDLNLGATLYEPTAPPRDREP